MLPVRQEKLHNLKRVIPLVLIPAIISLAACGGQVTQGVEVPTATFDEETGGTPTPASETKEQFIPQEYSIDADNTLTLFLDQAGQLVRYKFTGKNQPQEGIFSQDNIQNVLQKAQETQQPEILLSFPYTPQLLPWLQFQETPDRPRCTGEVSADKVYSDEELAGFGIKIINAPNVRFYIRKVADSFPEIVAQAKQNFGRHPNITIVLVPGPVLSQRYLTDSRYDQVRHFLDIKDPVLSEAEIELYRQQQLDELNQELLTLTDQLQSGYKKNDQVIISQLTAYIVLVKTRIQIAQSQSQEDFLEKFVIEENPGARTVVVQNSQQQEDPVVVFIAVGASKTQSSINISIDPEGEIWVIPISGGFGSNQIPASSMNLPRPSDFFPVEADWQQQTGYLWDAENGPVWPMYHELLGHLFLYLTGDYLKKNGPALETAAENMAMEKIREAWEKFRQNGDDTGYWFILTIPQENGGGYIISERPASLSSTSQVALGVIKEIRKYRQRERQIAALQKRIQSEQAICSRNSPIVSSLRGQIARLLKQQKEAYTRLQTL